MRGEKKSAAAAKDKIEQLIFSELATQPLPLLHMQSLHWQDKLEILQCKQRRQNKVCRPFSTPLPTGLGGATESGG